MNDQTTDQPQPQYSPDTYTIQELINFGIQAQHRAHQHMLDKALEAALLPLSMNDWPALITTAIIALNPHHHNVNQLLSDIAAELNAHLSTRLSLDLA